MPESKKRQAAQLRFDYEQRHRVSLGSLFAGIGGLELGLERALSDAGFDAGTLYQIERNPYARAVLAKHWRRVTVHDDVRDVVGSTPSTRATWVIGGSPCQDISKSAYRWGRKGLSGDRSGLWGEMARIVAEQSPDGVLWENVGGALCVMREKGKVVGPAPVAVVLSDLDDRGYDAWWTTCLAASVGAPHLRARVFLFAWPRTGRSGPFSVGSHASVGMETGDGHWVSGPCDPPAAWEPARQIRSSSDVPFHMERIECDGNSVVPQCAYAVGVAAAALYSRFVLRAHGGAKAARSGLPERDPVTRGAALARDALAMAGGSADVREFASLRGVRASASGLLMPWPSSGVMLGGSVLSRPSAPARSRAVNCLLSSSCDGSDPVDVRELCFWPTATARDWRSGRASDATRSRNARPLSEVAAPGGFLHPDWVDALMGYYPGYTRVEDPGFAPRRRGSKPT